MLYLDIDTGRLIVEETLRNVGSKSKSIASSVSEYLCISSRTAYVMPQHISPEVFDPVHLRKSVQRIQRAVISLDPAGSIVSRYI